LRNPRRKKYKVAARLLNAFNPVATTRKRWERELKRLIKDNKYDEDEYLDEIIGRSEQIARISLMYTKSTGWFIPPEKHIQVRVPVWKSPFTEVFLHEDTYYGTDKKGNTHESKVLALALEYGYFEHGHIKASEKLASPIILRP